MTFSYDQIHLPPLSNLVFTLSLYMELQVHIFQNVKSEFKNSWFQVFQNPQRTIGFHERTSKDSAVLKVII